MHFNDVEGMRMRPMALSLPTRRRRQGSSLITWKLCLPCDMRDRSREIPRLARALFATCAACHGDNGAGNQDLRAPRLAGVDDWYLATELRKFRSGVRGTNPKDREGQIDAPDGADPGR